MRASMWFARQRAGWALAAVALVLAAAAQPAGATVYQATDITQEAGIDRAGLNTTGQVALTIWTGSCCDTAGYYSNGVFKDVPGTGFDASAVGVNDAGQIVGTTGDDMTGVYYAYRYRIGAPTLTRLPLLAPGRNTFAEAINGAGQVVGRGDTPAGLRGFLWDGHTMHTIGTFGGPNSRATATYAAGQAVGCADTASGHEHPFLYASGRLHDLGLPGGVPTVTDGCAVSVNASGTILGTAGDPSTNACQTWLWKGGTFTVLPMVAGDCITPGHIANSGQVAGSVHNVPVTWQAGRVAIITNAFTPFNPGYDPTVNTPVSNNLYGLIAFGSAGSGPSWLLTPITPFDDGAAAIAYSRGWSRIAEAGAYAGGLHTTTRRGATAQLRFTGKQVSVYGPTRPGLGGARVVLDGHVVATVSENHAASERHRLFTRIFAARGAHTLRLVATGGRFSLDAITVAPH
jgi:probable HAF family extracellular repeat protein